MFSKGKSGNPSGRPKGMPDKRTALRELLTPHAPDLVAKAVELAMQGDKTALRMCIDRLIPPLRAQSTQTQIDVKGSLSERGEAILTSNHCSYSSSNDSALLRAGLAIDPNSTEGSPPCFRQSLALSRLIRASAKDTSG